MGPRDGTRKGEGDTLHDSTDGHLENQVRGIWFGKGTQLANLI